MKYVAVLAGALVLMGMPACASKRKPPPLVPLALVSTEVKPQAVTLTEQGTQAYQVKQFEAARKYFEQAMAVAPDSGQAHYNYALALNALGDTEVARQHFLDAANLAPGDKAIWDSPALFQYGDVSTEKRTKDRPYGTERPTFGHLPRR